MTATPQADDKRDEDKIPVILQVLPALNTGGVEQGTIDMASFLKQIGWQPIVASSGGRREIDLQRRRIVHATLPLASKNPLTMIRNIGRLKRLIRRHQVDIVHVRSRAPAWSAWYACKATGARYLTTFHGTYGHRGPFKKAYNRIMTRGKRIIAVSQHIAQHLKDIYSVSETKIKTIHRGVDLKVFDPQQVTPQRLVNQAQAWRLPEEKLIIMIPGRLSRWKGQAFILDALSQVSRSDFFCVFVGKAATGSTYGRKLEDMVRDMGLTEKVRFVGNCEDMPVAYLLADLVISSSLEPEAFGRVMAEAGAMGRPVLASDIGGAQEIVVPGETGWLYQAQNHADFLAHLDTAMNLNIPERKRMAVTARSRITAHFSLEQMQQKTLAVYQDLLSNDGA